MLKKNPLNQIRDDEICESAVDTVGLDVDVMPLFQKK